MKQSDGKKLSPPDSEPPIATFGEVFPDAFIELVRAGDSKSVKLLRWDGCNGVIGEVVEHCGQRYKAGGLHETISRELRLPAQASSFESVRELLAEICALVVQFVGLPEKFTALVGRFILATWLVDAMQIAPRMLIEGSDYARAGQLVKLLRSTCRRALPMSAVTPPALCSLPSGMRFTLLLHENTVSSKLATLLRTATARDNPILRAGQLVDLFGSQAILSDAGFGDETWASSIRVPCMPIGERLPILDNEHQRTIAEYIQPKLLAFRFSNYRAASASVFDNAKFAIQLQGLSASFAAATPGDSELQGELQTLFEHENAEIEAANWVDLNTIIIESILVHCREAKMKSVYVGEIASMGEAILGGRGECRKLDPGQVGRRIKTLGFSTKRDVGGFKLRLTNAVCVRVNDLAHQFNVPAVHSANACM